MMKTYYHVQICGNSFICSQLPALSSRAVQLGSLFVRGLSHLLGANTASGGPLPSDALMPWHSFDGRLFHSKYLLAHSGKEKSELLDNNVRRIKKNSRDLCKLFILRERKGGLDSVLFEKHFIFVLF